MAAAKKDRWQATIRTLWAIAKSPELHMDSEDLHAVDHPHALGDCKIARAAHGFGRPSRGCLP